ncbi:early endosome antigen 1 isoform X2 [Microplitis mediator]|uniref:early endosome antigen 1 isoform X2 n=1 Tax=Microplitis mediator TaxID=375433 RepID=UPI002555C6FB|nr:early endosome antigen 1 isoform X2 [Microplitis mediator]
MKRRRSRIKNQSRSSTISPKINQDSSPLKSKSFQLVKQRHVHKNVPQINKYEALEEGSLNYREFLESLESFFDVKKPLRSLESLFRTYLDSEESSSETTESEKSSEFHEINAYPHFRPINCQNVIQSYQVTGEYNFNQFDDLSVNSTEERDNLEMAEDDSDGKEEHFDIERETFVSSVTSRDIMDEEGQRSENFREERPEERELKDEELNVTEEVQKDDNFKGDKNEEVDVGVNGEEMYNIDNENIEERKEEMVQKNSQPSKKSFSSLGGSKNENIEERKEEMVQKNSQPSKKSFSSLEGSKNENTEEKKEEIVKKDSQSSRKSLSSSGVSKKESNKSKEENFKSIKEEITSDKEDIRSVREDLKSVKEEIKSIKEENISRDLLGDDTQIDDLMAMMDTAMIDKMTEAYKQLSILQEEIDELQNELEELRRKEDLTDIEKNTLEKKSRDVINKTEELDILTKKIQDILGIQDPTSIDGYVQALGLITQSDEPKAEEEETDKVNAWKNWEAISQEDCFDLPQEEYPEDRLPRVIVCGKTEERIPRIIVADSKKKINTDVKYLENIAEKFSDALNVQEKLARENAQLEGGKYKLEQALLEKDDTVEDLQRTVCNLQAEMRMVIKKNTELSLQVASLNEQVINYSCPGSFQNSPRSANYRTSPRYDNSNYCPGSLTERSRLGGGGSGHDICSQLGCCRPVIPPVSMTELKFNRGVCPAEIGSKLFDRDTNTKQLEQQIGEVEQNVQTMRKELANVTRETLQLEQQRKLLKCTAPCAPCPCPNQSDLRGTPSDRGVLNSMPQDLTFAKMQFPTTGIPSCTGVCTQAPMGGSNCPLQQLRDLREQYARLKEDYNNKLREVSYLRSDAEKMKQETRDAKDEKEKIENQLIDLQERLKCFESDRNRFAGSKEQVMEQEQTLIVARQRYREAQDELEELRSLIQDQANQLEDYRNKYLHAQEQVEDQRRQLELMEMDNARMNENVTLEIGRVKNQFQEKLLELAPLPDILKQTQLKLQECQQMRLLAERNCEELSRELMNCKDKIGAMTSQSEMLRSENVLLKGSDQLEDLENRNRELKNENERLKNACARSEERESEYKQRIDEKMHEIAQLSSMLEQVREDSARQVARTKDRCETVRRNMQAQIGDLEKQLAQCRATAKAAQRDRDEIRQKMQGQINHLSEAFEQAQGRVRTLQGQVNYLNTSYSNVFNVGTRAETPITSMPLETSQNIYDSCNCNY